jgi:transposase InsO family protein
MQIQQYSFDIVHRPGKMHGNADALSRAPLNITNPYGEEKVEELYEAAVSKEDILTGVTNALRQTVNLSAIKTVQNTLFAKVVQALSRQKGATTQASTSSTIVAHMVVEGEVPVVDEAVLTTLQAEAMIAESGFKRLTQHRNAKQFNGLWCIVSTDGRFRAVVPNKAKAALLAQNHNAPLAGHNGVRRTYRSMARDYYWRGMYKDVKRWIGACSRCTKRKTPRPLRAGERAFVQASTANETWAIDIVGPMPETDEGYKWALTCIDTFTRWPIVTPLRDRSEKSIVNALYVMVSDRGRPENIISDQGKELIGKAVKSLCKQWMIRKVQTGGYNPTGNSSIERFHKYLHASLTILGDQTTPDWTEFIPAVLFSYRASVNDSTGSSPFVLEHGRDPNLPQGLKIHIKHYESVSQHVDAITKRLREAWALARTMQKSVAETNAQRRPQGVNVTFNQGDLVYIWGPTIDDRRLHRTRPSAGESQEDKLRRLALESVKLPGKLSNKWSGPFTVIRKATNLYYTIDKHGIEKNYHVNRLTKHHSWDDIASDTSTWFQKEGVLPTRAERITSQIQPEGDKKVEVKEGDFIIFPMLMSDTNPWPVGIGKVIDASNKNHISFQYWGKTKANINGVMHPCWLDPSDSKIYYRTKRQHQKHPAVLSDNYLDVISTRSVICSFPSLLDNGRLRDDVKQSIIRDKRVEESWKNTHFNNTD